jgi:hypothetical protein
VRVDHIHYSPRARLDSQFARPVTLTSLAIRVCFLTTSGKAVIALPTPECVAFKARLKGGRHNIGPDMDDTPPPAVVDTGFSLDPEK